jgi:predicted dehydrogenase
LDVSELGVVEIDPELRERTAGELGIEAFAEMGAGLKWSPDFVVIATPTHMHVAQAAEVASVARALFIEKPLACTRAGISDLSALVRDRGVISMVGCNMRFHPGPQKVKELLDSGQLGRILSARIHVGSYLPAWRPGTDYRLNYAAREETGGGCILDCIHEIDLACWYLGDVVEVFCAAGHLSSLEIATEDVAVIVGRHESGALSEVHLDYVQRTYERGCQIAGEDGSVFWDFRDGQVRWFDAGSDGWTKFEQPAGWKVNQMYVDEMQYFLECVRERRETMLPVAAAARLMDLVFAAKRSAAEKRMITLGEESPA